MTCDVENLWTAIGILKDRLDDQADFWQLAEIRANIARETRCAGINADARDEPGIGGLCFFVQADLRLRASNLRLRAARDGLKLLERCVRPDRHAFRGVEGTKRRDVSDGDEVSEIFGPRGNWEKPGYVVGRKRRVRLCLCGEGSARRTASALLVERAATSTRREQNSEPS